MKCFVHLDKEAIAACKTCGKGMCDNCSAYSNHSGICPECRKKEYEEELNDVSSEIRSCTIRIVLASIIGALLFVCFVAIAIGVSFLCLAIAGGFVCKYVFDRKKHQERSEFLVAEIAKLSKALTRGSAVI